jgi:hypothetical protein
MPTTTLATGYQITMTQNTVYALPGRKVTLFCDAAAPTFEQSTDLAFTLAKAVTLTNGQAILAGGFVRCTSGNVTVWLRQD